MRFFTFADGSIISIDKIVKIIMINGYWTIYYDNGTWTPISNEAKKELDKKLEDL